MYYREWERRQRRNALVRAALAWAGLLGAGMALVGIGWLAIVGAMVVFG